MGFMTEDIVKYMDLWTGLNKKGKITIRKLLVFWTQVKMVEEKGMLFD